MRASTRKSDERQSSSRARLGAWLNENLLISNLSRALPPSGASRMSAARTCSFSGGAGAPPPHGAPITGRSANTVSPRANARSAKRPSPLPGDARTSRS